MINRCVSSIQVNTRESKIVLVFVSLLMLGFVAGAQVTYRWNKTGTQSWTTATNWTPTRNLPSTSDILVFDGNGVSGTVTTVTNVPIQTIGGLLISNNTNVTFTTPAAAGVYTLSINNGTAVTDFSVASGSQLNLAGSRATVISLATGAKAAIAGNISFSNAAHQLLAASAGAVVFNSPAVFTASTGFTGNAFGNTGTAGTVVFSAGTTYASTAGSDPFGLTAPASKVVFNGGSLFQANQANGAGVVFNGRYYANIQFNGTGTADLSGTLGFTADSITVNTGTVNVAMTGNSFIKGNINLARRAVLNFNGNSTPLVLNGTNQTIYGRGRMGLNNGQKLEVGATTSLNWALTRSATVTGAATAITVKGRMNLADRILTGTGNFVVADAGTIEIGSAAGIVAAGTNTGNVQTTGRTYSAAANYVYTGTVSQATGSGLPLTVNSFTIKNTGTSTNNTITLTNAVSITGTAGSLNLQSGMLNLNNKQISIPNGGTVIRTAGGFTTTAGTVVFVGAGTVTGAVTFPSVTVAGPVNFGLASVITTSLQINSGGSVITNAPTYGAASTLTYACGCSSFNTGYEWAAGTTAGLGVPANINVNLSGASNSITLSGDRTVVGRLTLTNGNLAIGSHILTLNGNVTRVNGFIAGSHSSELLIKAAAGSLYFAAGGASDYLKNLTINNAASATLGTALNITAGLSAGTEGTLSVLGTGVLTTQGLLTIKSNQYGTARIAEGRTTGGYIVGNVTVERFIPKNTNKGWRLVAASTSGQTIKQAWQENQPAMSNANPGYGIMIPGKAASLAAVQTAGFDSLAPGYSLLKYNPLTDNLDPVLNTNTTAISSEQGYFVFIRGDRSAGQMGLAAGNTATTSTTLRSTGSVYQGNQPAVNVPAGTYALVRNPYASAIDLTKVVTTGGLVKAFQVWDPKLNGLYGSGAYQTFTRSGANYVITPGGGSYGVNGSMNNFIESGSAFFVQSTATAGTVQVLENCKISGSKLVFRPSGNNSADIRLLFNLYANNTNGSDLVDGGLVFFDDASSNDVDVEDVRKSPNFGENIGIFKSSNELVVEKRPLVTTDDTLQFKMYQLKQITYTLQLVAENMEQPGITAYLFDKYLNVEVPVNLNDTTVYNFTVNAVAASKASDRFKILFRHVIVLPVTFISVKAMPAGKNIAVEWKVGAQLNVDHYELERSLDGSVFNKIAEVNIHSENIYNTIDNNVFSGTGFYRVKAVESNGRIQYSDIVKYTDSRILNGITVSPNPVKNGTVNVLFKKQSSGQYQINLINAQGQVVERSVFQHTEPGMIHQLKLPDGLPDGIYELLITGSGNVMTSQRLVISR